MEMASPKGIRGTPERLAQLIAGQVVNLVIESLDFDALLGRINMNALLERIDVNELLEQVDVNRLMGQIDVNALMSDIDLDALVRAYRARGAHRAIDDERHGRGARRRTSGGRWSRRFRRPTGRSPVAERARHASAWPGTAGGRVGPAGQRGLTAEE